MPTRWLVTGTTLLCALLAVCDMSGPRTEAFEYSGYCQKMCAYGRGGNLCKCNAVHFAGKRNQNRNDGNLLDELTLSESLLEELEKPPVTSSEKHVIEESLEEKWTDDEGKLGLAAQIELLFERHPALKQTLRHLMDASSRKRRGVSAQARSFQQ